MFFYSKNGKLETTKFGEIYLVLISCKEALKRFIQKDPTWPRFMPFWFKKRFKNYFKVSLFDL